jgi:hypothetical protein
MKIGGVFECGLQGADVQVMQVLVKKIGDEIGKKIDLDVVTLNVKPTLIHNCGEATAKLLAGGCEKVFIFWDLYPAWRTGNPCLHEDRIAILESLKNAGVDLNKVKLVCIEEELETWLIADGRTLSAVLSRPTHKVKIKDVKHPDRKKNPKGYLSKIFKEHTGRLYSDMTDARKIADLIDDLKKLKKIESFNRLFDTLK